MVDPRQATPLATLAVLLMFVLNAKAAGPIPEGTIGEIRIEGNVSIGEDEIRRHIVTRTGRAYDPATVEIDYKNLNNTGWFTSVKTYLDDHDPKHLILIYRVQEAPVLRAVEFRGATKIRIKTLEENTGMKAGSRADHLKAMLAVNSIKRLYEEKGYEMAEVKLLEGGKPGDTRVIFQIFEGPKNHITDIDFVGNTIVSDAVLRTKISSRTAILGLGGRYHRDSVEEDARKLRDYYHSMGFFEVQVAHVLKPGDDNGDLLLEFDISEGIQFKVRNVSFDGNQLLSEAKLRDGLLMHSNKPFSDALREADQKNLEDKYGVIGCIDAQIVPEHRYTDTPGVVDIVYRIEEGEPYTLGHFLVRGNKRTRSKVIIREAEMAGVVPGEPLNVKNIELYQKRLGNLRYFATTPDMGKPIEVKLMNRRAHDQPYGQTPMFDLDQVIRTRLQDPGPEILPEDVLPPVQPQPAPGVGPGFGVDGMFDPPPDQIVPPINVGALPGPAEVPGAGVSPPPMTPPIGAGEPPALEPSLPGGNMTDVGPDRQEPFPNRAYVDVVTQVDEAPTGRLMFGVGASSFQGLSGSFILHESNFDLFAVPRTAREFLSGQAFRGAGQDLRIELSPGTLINRALISFSDPYLFDLPIGFGASGYVFNRVYPDFTEARGGGRFSIGRQFGVQTYADVAVRAEDVNFSNFRYPRRPITWPPPAIPSSTPSAPVCGSTIATTPSPRRRDSIWNSRLSKAGARSPIRRSRSKAGSTSPSEAVPTARVSGYWP